MAMVISLGEVPTRASVAAARSGTVNAASARIGAPVAPPAQLGVVVQRLLLAEQQERAE
jgi:hypothetical protein